MSRQRNIRLVLSTWDYDSERVGRELGDSFLSLGEGMELANYLFMSAADVFCEIVDLDKRSFAISFEHIAHIPRLNIERNLPTNHRGYSYMFYNGNGDRDILRVRHMVRAYAIAFPNLCSGRVKEYLAIHPSSLIDI